MVDTRRGLPGGGGNEGPPQADGGHPRIKSGAGYGFVLVVVVHTDNIQDRDDARLGLAKLLGNFPRLQLIWADAGYSTESHERVRPAPLTADFDEPDQDANERANSPAGPGRFLCPAPCIVRAEPFWLSAVPLGSPSTRRSSAKSQ